ncbi:UNVERIFIED_CONTAM: hypothetical protein FKN15_076056 [Acipenser sinensis]
MRSSHSWFLHYFNPSPEFQNTAQAGYNLGMIRAALMHTVPAHKGYLTPRDPGSCWNPSWKHYTGNITVSLSKKEHFVTVRKRLVVQFEPYRLREDIFGNHTLSLN